MSLTPIRFQSLIKDDATLSLSQSLEPDRANACEVELTENGCLKIITAAFDTVTVFNKECTHATRYFFEKGICMRSEEFDVQESHTLNNYQLPQGTPLKIETTERILRNDDHTLFEEIVSKNGTFNHYTAYEDQINTETIQPNTEATLEEGHSLVKQHGSYTFSHLRGLSLAADFLSVFVLIIAIFLARDPSISVEILFFLFLLPSFLVEPQLMERFALSAGNISFAFNKYARIRVHIFFIFELP